MGACTKLKQDCLRAACPLFCRVCNCLLPALWEGKNGLVQWLLELLPEMRQQAIQALRPSHLFQQKALPSNAQRQGG